MKRILMAATMLAALVTAPAYAGVFVAGSQFTVTGANTPGTVLGVDNARIIDGIAQGIPTTTGTIGLVISEVPDGAGGEWIAFDYHGQPLVGSLTANWNLSEIGLQTNTATNFVGSFISFDATNITQVPTTCGIFGANFHVGADPTAQGFGPGCLANNFSIAEPAGPLGSLGTFINPFAFITNAGINPVGVNSYFQALDFRPQSVTPPGVPEPSTVLTLLIGVLGLGLARVPWRG